MSTQEQHNQQLTINQHYFSLFRKHSEISRNTLGKEYMFDALVGPANQDLIEMYCKSAEDMHRILSISGLSHIWETSNETAWVMIDY